MTAKEQEEATEEGIEDQGDQPEILAQNQIGKGTFFLQVCYEYPWVSSPNRGV